MNKVVLAVLLVAMVSKVALSQRTSLNNYTGSWENSASWVGGIAPPVANPANITAAHLDLTINGFITRTGDINIAGATSAEDFIINDTLVIIGNFSFPNDAAELVIGSSGVLIVIGNVSFGNNTRVTNNGIFAVSGNATFAPGGSDIYNDSGGGELFVQGNVTQNPAAQGADNWDNLDILYPVIHEFILCGGGPTCVLPVKITYFYATLRSSVVELRWATIMEENFQKFIVQRSSNGIEFEDLGMLPGRGFDIYDIESKYSFEDDNPFVGFNYYRLKAVDLDESFQYFGVRAIRVESQKYLSVYPNPASGREFSLRINFNPGESDRITIFNLAGKEIFTSPVKLIRSNIIFENKLEPGVYMVKYVSRDLEQTIRLVIAD